MRAMPLPKEPEIWSVSDLTKRVKSLLENQIGTVWVSGEISNWRVSPAGHAYFTLKDENSQLSAVMFRGKLGKLAFEPEGGLEVVVSGSITVYEKRGDYQIICEEMHPKGVGALQLAFEQLKRKLDEEGLFAPEHKKPLPLLPRRIGVVTSPTGAAIRDILNVIQRRFANAHVLLYPARVQGDEAAPEIVEGIQALDGYGVDVMIIGRGGGSLEDLWPFNEEAVVRAVFEAKTPIISAVGHEIDFALTDFAADVRAPTPSAAAELVVQEQKALQDRVAQAKRVLARAMTQRLESGRNRLAMASGSYVFKRPEELIRQRRQQVDEARQRLDQHMNEALADSRNRLKHAQRALALLSPVQQLQRAAERLSAARRRMVQCAATATQRYRARFQPLVVQLDALSPLSVLARGYALVQTYPDGAVVRDAGQLKPDDKLKLRFGKGEAIAAVETIEEDPDA